MNTYRVTVEYWYLDIEDQRQTARVVEWTTANSETMACFKIGAEYYADEDCNRLTRVYATLETN